MHLFATILEKGRFEILFRQRPSVDHHLLHEVNDPVLVVVAHVAGVEVALGVQHVLLGVQVSGTHLASLDADLPLGQG